MNIKQSWLWVFIVFSTVGGASLWAADASGQSGVELSYDVVDPSATLAKRLQKKGDYVTAMLLYEALLEKNPSDKELMHRLVECHEAQAHKESEEAATAANTVPRGRPEDLPDLPNLIPEDNAKAAAKPTTELSSIR